MKNLKTLAAVAVLAAMLSGCGTANSLTAGAKLPSKAVAAQGTFIDPELNPGKPCTTTGTGPSFTKQSVGDLAVTSVVLTAFHNFGGSGKTALVLGTRGGAALSIRFSRFADVNEPQTQITVDATINCQRTTAAEVATLLSGAELSPAFTKEVRASLLAMLKK
jgi:hypothetical protein